MYKEIIISIVIIIGIFSIDYVTQSYTENKMGEIVNQLGLIRQEIIKKDKDENKINQDLNNIFENWKNSHTKFAYYIEHDELEKVETSLVAFKGFVEVKEYETAVTELDKASFILEHIEQKTSLQLENIF